MDSLRLGVNVTVLLLLLIGGGYCGQQDDADAAFEVIDSFIVASEPACMPAATRAPNGDILVAYSTVWEPFPPGGTLKLVRSTDKGRTWSEPRVLWQPSDPRGGIHLGVGMTTLRDGTIVLPCTHHIIHKYDNVAEGERRPHLIYNLRDPRNEWEVYLLISHDSGASWRRKMIYRAAAEHRISSFGRIVQLENGQILVPAYWGKYGDPDQWRPELNNYAWRAHGFLRASSLQGPWELVDISFPIWYSELSPLLLKDGTLVAVMRNNGHNWPRRIFGISFSTDCGQNWTGPVSTGIRGKMPDLVQLSSGRVVMAVGAEGLADGSEMARHPERHCFVSLFYSDDGCRNWERAGDLAPIPGHPELIPSDGPVLVLLDNDELLVVMQAHDPRQAGDPLFGYSAGMVVVGNRVHIR